jgi:rubrerythrin
MVSDLFSIVLGIVGFITMIVFFVMAVALGNISHSVRNTNRIISAWSKETGIGLIYKCSKCKKSYEGRKTVCPHCGDPKTYV